MIRPIRSSRSVEHNQLNDPRSDFAGLGSSVKMAGRSVQSLNPARSYMWSDRLSTRYLTGRSDHTPQPGSDSTGILYWLWVCFHIKNWGPIFYTTLTVDDINDICVIEIVDYNVFTSQITIHDTFFLNLNHPMCNLHSPLCLSWSFHWRIRIL